jgi:ATP-dependent helicase/nuclease subunit A
LQVVVRGACDLLVERRSGSVDVIAVSTERAAADPVLEASLRAALLFVWRAYPHASLRVGVVSLVGPAPVEPRWLPDAGDHARFEREVAGLAGRLAEARRDGRFEGIVRPACERLACGFVGACHGDRR